MTVYTSAGSSVTALLGTVNNAATSVSSIFTTATKSVGMLDKFVSDAAERQEIRSVVDMNDFATKLAEEKAMEEAQRKLEVLKFTGPEGSDNERLYATAYDRIQKLLNDRTAKKEAALKANKE